MATDELVTYLNDHLSGASAALAVLERLISAADSAGDRRFFEDLKAEIEEDASTLEGLIERLGGKRNLVRQAGGLIAEKFAALKLRFDDPEGSGLSHFEAVEMLALGILGKRALWRVLRAAAADLPELGPLEYEMLEIRAQQQHDRVEARRVAAGRRIFTRAKTEASARES